MTSHRTIFLLLTGTLLGACRGEPVPRDYQNHPPSMTNPADSEAEAPIDPTATVGQEPDYGVEGTSAPYEPAKPPERPVTAGEDPPAGEGQDRETPPVD